MAIFVLNLVPPQPNLNGNTASSLVLQLSDICSALNEVTEAMRRASDLVHGRNFLPQGSEEAKLMRMLAEDAMKLRFDVVDTMRSEFMALAIELNKTND